MLSETPDPVRMQHTISCWLDIPLSPAASRGLILGEIFGLNAGLTRLALMLPLFFTLRPVFASSFLLDVMEKAGLAGVDIGSSIGLGLFDIAAPGVLSGPILGVLRADMRCVSYSSPSRKAVSILEIEGLDSSEASGRARSSIRGGAFMEASLEVST